MNAQISPRSEPLAQVGSFLARTHGLFIDGKFVPALSGEMFDVINPATGEVFAKAAAGGAEDIDLAVKAARRAFDSGPWSTMNPSGRRNLMWKLSDAIERNAEEIATLESLDNGMPITMARFMAAGASECLRYNAGWVGKISGETPNIAAPSCLHAARACWCGRRHHALERAARHGSGQNRFRSRGRLHRGVEAGGADSADRYSAGGAHCGSGLPARSGECRHRLWRSGR